MKKLNHKLSGILAIAAVLVIANGPAANAGDLQENSSSLELAYAPQGDELDYRFDQFESEEELHELNDAWLGMPVHNKHGKLVGFVEDAFLDDQDNLSELLVSLSGKNYAVYVDGKHAELTDYEVGVNLTTKAIAGLEREANFQVSLR